VFKAEVILRLLEHTLDGNKPIDLVQKLVLFLQLDNVVNYYSFFEAKIVRNHSVEIIRELIQLHFLSLGAIHQYLIDFVQGFVSFLYN